MSNDAKNIVWHHGHVGRSEREARLGQTGCVIWFTGLSGSGKSTLARAVEERLATAGRLAYVLDGDNVRHGLNSDLGFTRADREENIRRISEVAALFADAGLLVLVAFISSYREDRTKARARVAGHLGAENRFIEVFVDAPLEVCEQRDPKGLYRKARAGELIEFTGISAPYEAPENPEVRIDTASGDLAPNVDHLIDCLVQRGVIPASSC